MCKEEASSRLVLASRDGLKCVDDVTEEDTGLVSGHIEPRTVNPEVLEILPVLHELELVVGEGGVVEVENGRCWRYCR